MSQTVTLQLDRQNEDGTHPTFHFREPRLEDQMAIGDLLDTDGQDVQALHAARRKLLEQIRAMITGWEHVRDADGNEIEFEPARLERGITLVELWMLGGRLDLHADPGAEEKKDSDSPSDASTA